MQAREEHARPVSSQCCTDLRHSAQLGHPRGGLHEAAQRHDGSRIIRVILTLRESRAAYARSVPAPHGERETEAAAAPRARPTVGAYYRRLCTLHQLYTFF